LHHQGLSFIPVPSAFNSAFHLHTDEMLSFRNIIVAIAMFAVGAISAPIDPSPVRSLANTATPTIGAGYTAQQTVQITVVSATGELIAPVLFRDSILAKYFDLEDNELSIGSRLLEVRSDASSPSPARPTPYLSLHKIPFQEVTEHRPSHIRHRLFLAGNFHPANDSGLPEWTLGEDGTH
jgi:hypothetical protein